MRMHLPTIVALICILSFVAAIDFQPYRRTIWTSWKRVFQKQFASNPKEDGYRMRIFFRNMEFVRQHNKRYYTGLETYATRLNQFSAMTPREFKQNYLTLQSKPFFKAWTKIKYFKPELTISPSSIDWRKKGYVTDVKDQGQCGSCWAFSATGSLEGAVKNKTGKLVSLSEQQLVDCSGDEGNEGCNGGLMESAFKYLKQYGVESEKDYPYMADDQICNYSSSKVIANVTGFVSVLHGSEMQLQLAVANVGPVSVAIDASGAGFMSYSHGIYSARDCSPEELNHGVLAVGYDKQRSEEYWIVKNSWSHSWGMDGYILMARNKRNMCGIATMASYPTV